MKRREFLAGFVSLLGGMACKAYGTGKKIPLEFEAPFSVGTYPPDDGIDRLTYPDQESIDFKTLEKRVSELPVKDMQLHSKLIIPEKFIYEPLRKDLLEMVSSENKHKPIDISRWLFANLVSGYNPSTKIELVDDWKEFIKAYPNMPETCIALPDHTKNTVFIGGGLTVYLTSILLVHEFVHFATGLPYYNYRSLKMEEASGYAAQKVADYELARGLEPSFKGPFFSGIADRVIGGNGTETEQAALKYMWTLRNKLDPEAKLLEHKYPIGSTNWLYRNSKIQKSYKKAFDKIIAGSLD